MAAFIFKKKLTPYLKDLQFCTTVSDPDLVFAKKNCKKQIYTRIKAMKINTNERMKYEGH